MKWFKMAEIMQVTPLSQSMFLVSLYSIRPAQQMDTYKSKKEC